MKDRVVVIGSGLGGLECGYILAKSGMQVTVLEKEAQIGGCLQTFRRGGLLFDTGLHYVGGLDENGSLRPLFDYFGLMDLPWKRMDEDCFDEVWIGDRRFAFAQGHERFVETLAEAFPKEREHLKTYAEMLRQVGLHIWDSLGDRDAEEVYSRSLFARSAWGWLEETIEDPLLRKVLSGTSLKLQLDRERLPLYVFAQINNSFIQSAWRLVGGGGLIADRLTERIEQFGGRVRTRAEVTELIEKEGRIAEVVVNGEERIACDWVISDAHPAVTLDLVKESQVLRGIYRRRIERLENSVGMFTVNIRLLKSAMRYENKNRYLYNETADLWDLKTDKVESALVHYYPMESQRSTAKQIVWSAAEERKVKGPGAFELEAIDIMTPMRKGDLPDWESERPGHRGATYEQFKREKAAECIRFVGERLPALKGAVDAFWTSTPLTYESYTGTKEGSAYGIVKDWQSPMTTVLSPRTPIENLLLTGQSLNLHGVLGTSMTSLFTTAKMLGKEKIRQEFKI